MNENVIYQIDRPYNHFQSKSVISSSVLESQTSPNNECLFIFDY